MSMDDKEKALSADTEFLSGWTRRTRTDPTRFARGAALLEREFSFDAIQARREEEQKRELEEARRGNRESFRRELANELRGLRLTLRLRGVERRLANAFVKEKSRAPFLRMTPFLSMLETKAREDLSQREREDAPFTWPRDEALSWAREQRPEMSHQEAEAVLLVAVFFYDNASAPNPALPPTFQRIPFGEFEDLGRKEDWRRDRWPVFFVHGFDERLLQAARWAASRLQSQATDEPVPSPRHSATQKQPSSVVDAPDAEQHFDLSHKRLLWLAKAMLLVKEHPDWSNAEIARRVGISPSRISRSEEYQAAAALARGNPDAPKGFVTRDPTTKQRDIEGRYEDLEIADEDQDLMADEV